MPFLLPDNDVVSIIDAPPTPLAVPAPGEKYIVLVHYQSHPPISLLARPVARLAGVRLDPAIGGRQRTRRFHGLSVLRISDGAERTIALPPDTQVSLPVFTPDGRRFAFMADEPDGIGVWVAETESDADPVPVPGLRVVDTLGGEPPGTGATIAWSRDGGSLIALGAPPRAAGKPLRQPESQPRVVPRLDEAIGKKSKMATFQDLLTTPADGDLFEELATTVPLRVDPSTGAAEQFGPPGLYQYIDDSPDGRYVLVYRLKRPFSYRVPYGYFTRSVEVWTAAGERVAVIADLPVSDEVPMMGVPTGPRIASWDERAPARLLWMQALDGGDPLAQVPHRDEIMSLEAPFDADPARVWLTEHRCLGWSHLEASGEIWMTEYDREQRWLRTWICDLARPESGRLLFELAEDDAYADPGDPMLVLHPDGSRTIRQDGPEVFLRGDGATPDGDRPFVDRYNVSTGEATRLFHSPADVHESVVCFAAGRTDMAVIWHQSKTEPPNLWVTAVAGDADDDDQPAGQARRLTDWPDPHPQLTGLEKRVILTEREDGVQLSGMLYLPPGYDQARDGSLPLVMWAYPYDYGSASTAGQIRVTGTRFTRLTSGDPVWFVMRGYAVLANATMPVIGDPETKNDTYLEQITAAATAHIKALTSSGIADPARIAVGGHSYGAFMTANLLAHTDLFAAGIARSGAYNRTLTPFGFQSERRSFWEAPAVYDQVSPFRYADRIAAPILLVHGEADGNSGTFPVQSERLFQAIQGNGGTARLVILPHENHSYIARESVLHVLAEQFGWLERWLGNGKEPS
ncbi:MAG TPA: prolyl oligopeptidase family serine peptidase [Streptosporangiaceae bacterium]|nr:prolyl oligopeptidase family serine peptidase [Streptosporangiaceae bacterium]